MAVRIDSLKLDRGGPLDSAFRIPEAGDLNLVYGPNESGKTYIVEFMLRALFKTGPQSPGRWKLRDWHRKGRIVVSGIESDPTPFTVTGKKLEDFWKDDASGLPTNFSRLIVIKEGESRLGTDNGEVEEDILRTYLSGEGLLGAIERRISATIRGAKVEAEEITGSDKGELADRRKRRTVLDRIDSLVTQLDTGYTSGAMRSLTEDRRRLKDVKARLLMAKRHHAAKLYTQIEDLKERIARLPDETRLSSLYGKVEAYERQSESIKKKQETLTGLDKAAGDYAWVGNVKEQYEAIAQTMVAAKPSLRYLVLAVAFILAAPISGLIGRSVAQIQVTLAFWTPLLACLVAAVLSLLAHDRKARERASAIAVDNMEMTNLKTEFKRRFDVELTDMSAIQTQLDRLNEDHVKARIIRDEIPELEVDLGAEANLISKTLESYCGEDIPPADWGRKIDELGNARSSLSEEVGDLKVELAALNVPPEDYVANDPGDRWDPEQFDEILEGISQVDDEIENEEENLRDLKTRLAAETGRDRDDPLDELFTAIQEARSEAARLYREKTAEILAKTQVNDVVVELREKENERIREGLTRREVTEPLLQVTERYPGIDFEQGELVLTDRDDDTFKLSDLSTGAREQVFLALRIGFASIAMKGDTGFLILDDAFQHSDWNRRKNLVNKAMSLVKAGWQVFYFTMDDHIRDLFRAHEHDLGDRFAYHELT